jgi:hypothetical protein
MARELKEEGIGNKVLYCPPAHAQPVAELGQSRTEECPSNSPLVPFTLHLA